MDCEEELNYHGNEDKVLFEYGALYFDYLEDDEVV